MEDLLYLHPTAECSDFHDKIYALISLTTEAQTLSVDYNIDRAQLMLTTLHFSSTYHNLSAFRALSYMSFLQQHLEVGRDELRDRILNLKNDILSDANFAIRGTNIGRASSLDHGRKIEEQVLRLRHRLLALFVPHKLFLNVEEPSSLSLEFGLEALSDTRAMYHSRHSGD